jgi:hypothetical protein
MTDPIVTEGDHLTIDDRLVRQLRQTRDVEISHAEVVVVARAQVDLPPVLNAMAL